MIPHNQPSLDREEDRAALRVLRSGWIAQGKEVESFESEFCQFLGISEDHAVAVSSGTAALYLALWSLKASGKTVAIPAYACSALRHATALAGAREAILDTDGDGPNVELTALKSCGASLAIVPHMFGLPIDLSSVKHMDVVEDCAHALGARIDGKHVGLQGRASIYSFYATKLMTSGGQGGMVVSKDRALIDAVRDFRQFDYRHDDKKRFNFQMTDMQAAIGRAQLRKLPKFLSRRAAIFTRYREAGFDLLDVSVKNRKRHSPVRYRAVAKTDDPKGLIKALASRKVKAIVPIEDWELLGQPDLLPNALDMTRRTVSLPIYPSMTDEVVDWVVAAIGKN